jgi:glutamate synthase domain-containing protein 2
MMTLSIILILLVGLFIHDRFIQKKHIILTNYPIVGHLRFLFESIGPEMRQYFVAGNREERPFNRIQRAYVYASSKEQNNMQGFGSDADFTKTGQFFIKHATFPYRVEDNHINHSQKDFLPCAKIIGTYNKRQKPFHPKSIVNISAMSYGSLGSGATESNNRGAGIAGCYHNTGEGGFSQYHNTGADVVFQMGTAYYGCRDDKGRFSMEELVRLTSENKNIKMIEIKLSQGAKPGKGGILPAEKVTKEIAAIRKIKVGEASLSPAFHTAFSNEKSLIQFIEEIASKTGLPVGIKSAVGQEDFWLKLIFFMKELNIGPDFITIDGGEGGTGAAPAAFADNVSLPFDLAFTRVYKLFQQHSLESRVTFIASAKLGLPAEAIKAFSLGADMINMAREILLSQGCIQAQKCHTGTCPTLIATNKNQHLYNIPYKSQRVGTYIKTLRKDILELTHACGYEHPCQMQTEDIEINVANSNLPVRLNDLYEYDKSPVEFATMEFLKSEYIERNINKIHVEGIAGKHNDEISKN